MQNECRAGELLVDPHVACTAANYDSMHTDDPLAAVEGSAAGSGGGVISNQYIGPPGGVSVGRSVGRCIFLLPSLRMGRTSTVQKPIR